MSSIQVYVQRPPSVANDSLWKLVAGPPPGNVVLPNSSSFVPLPTSIVAVAPTPYSVQYTPATNCVFTVQKAGFYSIIFSGVFSNGGSSVANTYASTGLVYTQGSNSYSEQGNSLTSPGSFGYSSQVTVSSYFAVNDTISPFILNFSGNTMTFNMKYFTVKYSPN